MPAVVRMAMEEQMIRPLRTTASTPLRARRRTAIER